MAKRQDFVFGWYYLVVSAYGYSPHCCHALNTKALEQIRFAFNYKIPIIDHSLAAKKAAIRHDHDVNIDYARLSEEITRLLFVVYFNKEFSRFEFLCLVRLADKAFNILLD